MKVISFVAILLLTVVAGCKKSFLEIPSKTALSTTVYYTKQSDFEQAINGAYSPLRNVSSNAWVMGEMRSDNTTYMLNPSQRPYLTPEYIADFTDDGSNDIPTSKYRNNFSIIARVNQILALIDGVSFDGSVKNNIKGQALFLRALAYFDLVQYFGGVPIHLTPVSKLEDTALPPSTADQVYAQVIADGTQAAALLPDKSKQEIGRATSGAANMLLGNVYIVQKKWADAETALKKITGYSLTASYADAFDPAKKNGVESVFEVQFKQGTEGFSSDFFYQFVPQPITGPEITAVTGIPENGLPYEGFNIPTPDIIAAYEANDTRKIASVGTLTAAGKLVPYIKKYLHPHALTNNTDDNWPIYRYAEVLLFLAEAANEQGRSSEALTFLNQVRNRAGLANLTDAAQTNVRALILQERRVELAFENKRWLDLVRSGTAPAVMTSFGNRIKANPQTYYFPLGYTVTPQSYTNIRLLFPLPAAEAALSPYF